MKRAWAGLAIVFALGALSVRAQSSADAELARRAFDDAQRALERVPDELQPRSLSVQAVRGAGPRIEFQPESGEVRVRAEERFDESVWLHEIAHARLARRAPSGLVAQRIERAVEEAVADYFAAVLGGSPQLGGEHDGPATRNLQTAPAPSAAAWARHFLPGVDPDPHELSRALAGLLWRRAPGSRPLVADLLAMLTATSSPSASERPSDVLAGLVARCPERSRTSVEAVLREWTPRELWP